MEEKRSEEQSDQEEKDTEGQTFRFKREGEVEPDEEKQGEGDDTEGHRFHGSDARLKSEIATTRGLAGLASL